MATISAMMPYKIAILSYHPMPYHAAFYRAVGADPRLDATVLFLDRYGIDAVFDPEFSTEVKWDLSLTDGYRHKFLKNISPSPTTPIVMRINPGLFSEILGGDYDAVLVTGYDTLSAQLAIWTTKLGGKKLLLRAEADLHNPSTPMRQRIKRLLLGPLLARCDAVLYSCQNNHAYFRHFGVDEKKTFPILSSVDIAGLRQTRDSDPERGARLRSECNIPPDAIIFLFCGRLIPRKRPQDLLAAFTHVTRAQPKAWLVIVGDGPLRDGLEKDARAQGLHNVLFSGFKNLSQISAYYQMADVFVISSEYDPTPKALNEAMTFALPAIVSTGIGTAHDLLIDNENGLVYETGDTAAFAASMLRLSLDRDLRQRMGDAAAKTVDAWSPQANVDGLVAALDFCFAGEGGS
ncbi:MAG: glycosyltransferase family 4 protein [Rhodospirillaceae bacterium]|nr:glycosyltransferase family 4 protein [Rhodospirillaceae bacterium]MBT5373309.1 glycosyltransferase family 4 protein [Rhodospirillaceae bacterium]MBT5659131.1 glycosyltransferase family 4 protein [Rhodospirillaceae bacterium]MBT5752248.1 glycosyltransferase family 4 protein [Rhodospirillaceae bacterium]